MKIKNGAFIFSLFLIILFSFFITPNAFASTGYIDTTATNQAKVCHDATCTTPTPGIINFELSAEPSIVIDTITGISGRVWGNELGWITMNPTGAGVRFADPTSGLLTGKAWSQVSGWVNFAVTGQNVTINPATGEFNGWAWTGGPYGGWIKFDCGDNSTCVKTTWRPDAAVVGGGAGGGGVSGGTTSTTTTTPPSTTPTSSDVCLNLNGLQESIPSGYTINDIGQCVKVTDKCPNLNGNQSTVPSGYILSNLGACVTSSSSSDSCPNLPGHQREVPDGYVVTANGNCIIPETTDICANLPDTQSVVPTGYYEQSGNCFLLPKSPETIPPSQKGEDATNTYQKSVTFVNNISDNFSDWIAKTGTALNRFLEQHLSWPIFVFWILLLLVLIYLLIRRYYVKK